MIGAQFHCPFHRDPFLGLHCILEAPAALRDHYHQLQGMTNTCRTLPPRTSVRQLIYRGVHSLNKHSCICLDMHAAPVSHNLQQLVEMSSVQRLVHAAVPSRGHLRADVPLNGAGRVRRSSVKSGRGLNPISATSLVNTPVAARGAARLLQAALPYSPSVDRNRQSEASSSISSDQNSEVWNPSCGWSRLPHHLDETQIWSVIREEAARDAASEPALASFLHSSILAHNSVGKAMAFVLADKLMSSTLLGTHLMKLISDAYEDDPSILEATIADIHAVYYRDPACDRYSTPILYFKGFQALQCSRIAHWLWKSGRRMLAEAIWSRVCEVFHVDIHPGAWLGRGIFVDHATGVVIGETAMVGDNCSLLHHVTLGGSGSSTGIRHPCIGHGVLLGAGACVLGPVSVGAGTKIGAGTVVVTDLPSHCVAVGVPARVVRRDRASEPVKDMDQTEGFILDYVI